MTRTGLPVVVVLVLMAMVAVGSAKAQPSQFQGSGSFVAGGTSIDTNGDGITADLFIVSGASTLLGLVTIQAVVEWTFDDEPTICPLGTVLEGTLVPAGSALVTRAGENRGPIVTGDLLFGAFTSGISCISENGVASISATGTFTGGTGRLFANATGDFTLTPPATVTPLVAGQEDDRGSRARRRSDRARPRPSPAFGSVVVTIEGILIVNLNP